MIVTGISCSANGAVPECSTASGMELYMSKTGLWAIAGVAVLTLLYLVYLAATFDAPEGTTTVVIPAPVQPPVVAQPNPSIGLPTTQIQTAPEVATVTGNTPVTIEPAPVEVAPVVTPPSSPTIELPTLNNSDTFVLTGLRAMQNGAALVRILANEQLVRKFVVFVDNVSRGSFPQTELPFRPLGQEMPVTNIDDNLFVMDVSAHARFDQAVDTFVAMDTDAAMTFYRTLSPLFQQAYSEIGFRNVAFDDTLRTAINRVISAADVEGPFQLVKPSVMYLYADSRIENLQAVNKQLIRIGPENSAKLKDKLRQFLAQL